MYAKSDNIRKKFAENIRRLRLSRGYSQEKFAQACNKSQAVISSWEIGIRQPELDVIFEVAECFHVPVSTLIPLEESGMAEDIDQKTIDMLHQNPRLCTTFDKTKYFDEKQMSVVMSVIDAIAKESEPSES